MNLIKGFKTSVKKVIVDVLEKAREPKLEMESHNMTELLNHMIKLEHFSCFLWMAKESNFLKQNLVLLKML